MPAALPVSVKLPLVETAMPVPACAEANVAVTPVALNDTLDASAGSTPVIKAAPVFKVAVAVPSYILLLAVIPETVTGLAVMSPVRFRVGWASE